MTLTEKPPIPRILSQKLGVWTLLTTTHTRRPLQEIFKSIVPTYRALCQVIYDVYCLAPGLLCMYILMSTWEAIESALFLHLSSSVLFIVEAGIRRGEMDASALAIAFGACMLGRCFSGLVSWQRDRVYPLLRHRVMMFYEEYILRIKLQTDMPSSNDASCKITATAGQGWRGFESVFTNVSTILSVLLEVLVVLRSSTSQYGPLYPLLCVMQPFVRLGVRHLWQMSFVSYSEDYDYNRAQSLSSLTDDTYRREIIGGGLTDYFVNEFATSRRNLGATCSDDVYVQYDQTISPWLTMLSCAATDFPMLYIILSAVQNPAGLSLADIAIQQHAAHSIRSTVHLLKYYSEDFTRSMAQLVELFEAKDTLTKLGDGGVTLETPSPCTGLSFELRNVVFEYPGNKTNTSSLKGINLHIKPGQLVVIVGSNGSGKSTLVNLLTRLYDVTSGDILVDSLPISDYSSASLRAYMALLNQDHHIFPFSLYENVALGYPAEFANKELVEDSVRRGGAAFTGKFKQGLDTVLYPIDNISTMNVHDKKDPGQVALLARSTELERQVDISGGERQKIVNSRTFMRLRSGKIRFVAVDEPSSALDADAELHLFENLLQLREGKTMVFVTHRFGHLTKHADVILFMKDGWIAEQGTHDELMALNSGYANLYGIQASAFK